jgi:phosphatidylglycerophosphatase A
MNVITDNYQLLLRKLDEFIRKFYINQLIRGAIYASALLLAAFLVINVLEYFIYFSSTIRSVLFFGFLGGALFVIIRWILLPLLHYHKLGKIISQENAAFIIGSHFKEVQDRLLNILQLRKQKQSINSEDATLIEASIDQKIGELKPVPFAAAINLKMNQKHLRYLILPVLALAFILFSSPDIIKEGTLRLIHHNEYFERQAPFQFNVSSTPLQTIQYQDYNLNIELNGKLLPDEAAININGFSYPLIKKNAGSYSYRFVKPQKDIPFYFSAAGFRSRDYTLRVIPKPIILKFNTDLTYPRYLGKNSESLQNIGDVNVPEGTIISWHFSSQNTSNINLHFGDSLYSSKQEENNRYSFTKRFKHDAPYTVFISSENLPNADSLHYSITVIPDRYPAISVSQVNDSTNKKYLYFIGEASDDYGLSMARLKYKLESAADQVNTEDFKSIPIKFSGGKTAQFSEFWDLNTLNLSPGDKVIYFFEVWDNDGVNGSKSTRSTYMTFSMATETEMDKQTGQNNEKIKEDLKSSIKEASKLKDEFEKLQTELLNKKNPTWEDKKKIEELITRQNELNRKIESAKETFKENLSNQSDYKEYTPELKEKQQELDKLFDQVLSPEMKELMDKMQEMLEKLNKDKTLDQLQDQKLSNQELEKELDRMLSLFKQLEFEQKLTDTKEKLDKLAEKEEELSEKTSNAKNPKAEKDSLTSKQEDIKNEFEEVQKDMEGLDSLNQELEQPHEIPDMQQQQQETKQEMEDAEKNLEKNNMKKASENEKNAAEKMKKMSEQMQQSMQEMQMQQMEMDMQSTRQILENLIKVSFDQEDLLNKTKGVNVYNPQYLQLMKEQYKLIDDIKMVEDSIQELSKRVFQIQGFVNQQVTDINKNVEQAVKSLEQRQPGASASAQQYVMTAVNNLALMFQEIMQEMQQQMANQMAGSQMCQKPSGKKPGMQSMKQMQQQLNDQISEFSKKMKDGKISKGEGGMSKELAQMAARQAAIREAIQKMNEELGNEGKNGPGNLDQIQKEMEKTETELVNKQITNEMLKRQQEILTRLLEAENSERERETDNKRESNSAKEMMKQLPPEIEEYLKKKQAELELYKTVPPNLKPFYRDLVEEYFKSLQQ